MIERLKVALTRMTMINVMESSNAPCACISCMSQHQERNTMPCVCKKLGIPCIAFKSKYTSAKALSELINDRNGFLVDDIMVIPYDETLVHQKFIELIKAKNKRIKERGISNESINSENV